MARDHLVDLVKPVRGNAKTFIDRYENKPELVVEHFVQCSPTLCNQFSLNVRDKAYAGTLTTIGILVHTLCDLIGAVADGTYDVQVHAYKQAGIIIDDILERCNEVLFADDSARRNDF